MKKLFLLSLVSLTLSACSLLHRNTEMDTDTSAVNDTATNPQAPSNSAQANLEQEVSKLKTRLEAMETKLDVISTSVERTQLKQAQPEIVAQQSPQPTMAAPVADAQANDEPVASRPAKVLPTKVVARPADMEDEAAPIAANPKDILVEKEFKAAMVFFQAGRNLEAASKFSGIAKQYPRHLLASHALYWAGEANARSQQWSNAIENWESVEKDYPHSTYIPETLAGLSRAFEAQGNPTKSKSYRDTLTRAFPASPVTLNLVTHESHESSGAAEPQQPATTTAAPATPVEEETTSEPQSTEQD